MGFLEFILYVSSHHLHIFQTFIFLFCFLSYFFDLLFHPLLLELSFYFNEIFIVSCPCFRDAIPSHCSLRIFIRTGLVAVWEVFFCLLYYLCFSQIALFSFAFLPWFLSFRMKAFLICLVTFDCLCFKTDWKFRDLARFMHNRLILRWWGRKLAIALVDSPNQCMEVFSPGQFSFSRENTASFLPCWGLSWSAH